MTTTRAHVVTRLSIAVLLVASATIGAATLSSAAPSREEVQQARERLDSLNRELDLMVEQYNQARLRLQEVQARLADVRDQAHRAQATADRAISSLNANAARAYRGVGSQIAELFESSSMADFSDRLEFIGSMAQADSDLAVEAESAQQEARWTAAELKATAEERRGIVDRGTEADWTGQGPPAAPQERAVYRSLQSIWRAEVTDRDLWCSVTSACRSVARLAFFYGWHGRLSGRADASDRSCSCAKSRRRRGCWRTATWRRQSGRSSVAG